MSRPEAVKLLEENIGIKFLNIDLDNDFFCCDTKSTGNQSKNRQVGLEKMKRLWQSKGNTWNKKGIYFTD